MRPLIEVNQQAIRLFDFFGNLVKVMETIPKNVKICLQINPLKILSMKLKIKEKELNDKLMSSYYRYS